MVKRRKRRRLSRAVTSRSMKEAPILFHANIRGRGYYN